MPQTPASRPIRRRLPGVVAPVRAALGKPGGATPATRWLFARLALLSLVLTTPILVATASGPARWAVAAAAMALAVSWTVGYLRGGAGVVADTADTLAVLVLAVAAQVPTGVFAVLVSALWLRSLDGTTLRAYLRPTAYALALAAGLLLRTQGVADAAPHALEHVLITVPILFVTVVVARRLAWTLIERERRDAVAQVHATAVANLIGVTDTATLRRVAQEADQGLCDALPGLRIVKVDAAGQDLLVDSLHGPWAARPARLPSVLLGADDALREAERPVAEPARLDVLAGEVCAWVALRLPVVPQLGAASWLLVGAPRAVPPSAVWVLRNLADHLDLAYSVVRAHDALLERATTDPLTGLANRAAFTAALEAALADEAQSEVSVLFVDMDDFKAINDRLGHQAGDQVLREVGARLLRAARPDDVCARIGGDEFAVLLPGAGARAAGVAAQRVAAAVRAPLRRAGDVVAPLSASVGCATARTGTRPDDLLRRADAAMYEAKRRAS